MKHLFIPLLIALLLTSASSQTPTAGIVLDRAWASPLQGGSQTMKDLGALLSPFAKPEASFGPSPDLTIYEGVTYLMPYAEAKTKLNLQQKVIAKDKVLCPGFPKDSFFSYAFDGNFEGHFNRLFIVVDKADQVVAVQLVAEAPKKDQVKAPFHKPDWHTYNFINTKSKAINTLWIDHHQFFEERGQWREYRPTDTYSHPKGEVGLLRIDSLLMNPMADRSGYMDHNKWKPLEAVRLYLPKPMMELILLDISKTSH